MTVYLIKFVLVTQDANKTDFFCVSGTVNFNHTFGCQKCMAKARKSAEANRMYYPEIGCASRTDEGFRNRMQPIHHKEFSYMENLPIDMISAFPTSDPLHLLELGMMKRCVFYTLHFLIPVFEFLLQKSMICVRFFFY